MFITLKSFEKIGNLTNKLNIVQNSNYNNRYFLEQITKRKTEYISDYFEDEAILVIDFLQSKIQSVEKVSSKDYNFYSISAPRIRQNKKGVTNKKPFIIE